MSVRLRIMTDNPYSYTHVPLHTMFYYYYQFHTIPYYHILCHTISYQFTCELVHWNKKVHVRCCMMSVQLCTMIHNSVSFLFMHRLLFSSDKWTKEQKEQLDKSISDYPMENCSDTQSITTQLEHITSITRTTERDQFLLLSTISNFH